MMLSDLLVEDEQDAKGEWLLPEGYVLSFRDVSDKTGVFHYEIHKLMEDKAEAKAVITNFKDPQWGFGIIGSLQDMEVVSVSPGNMYNMLRFKWWVTNRLIQFKLIAPLIKKNGDAN